MSLPKVDQEIQLSRGNEVGVVYISKVMDVTDKHIFFSMPTLLSTGHFGVFSAGDAITINYRAIDNSACTFRTKVDGQEARDSMVCYFVAKPSPKEVSRTQMREYVRASVPINTPLFFNFPDYPTLEAVKQKVLPCDISGGGIAFFIPPTTQVNIGDTLRVQFQLPGVTDVLTAAGHIIRIQDGSGEEIDLMRRVHFSFDTITDRDRQAIIRYVFQRQIELKARSRL